MHEIQAPEDPSQWFMVHHAPLHDGVICTFVEITHQKQQAAALNQKNEDLAKSNAELASFNYIASHDLQEPLRKIRMFSSSILESNERELSDKGKSMLARLNIAAERMQILINDLLLYSRTKSHEEEFEIIALQKLIEEVQQDLSEELQEKKAVIDADGLPKIKVLPFQFRQLLHNLIGNALKYSKPDIAPYITIRSKIAPAQEFPNMTLLTDRTYCHISFSDNGIGFEPQYSEKIFNVFQRLHGKDKYSGTGIGLSIVKRIVENHQGIITAQGETNKGATFNIFIPC
jgi:light-regulated signal transduction histidine kinase (bacteriophytochrome)